MPNIERRDFLKLIGAGGVGVGAGFALGEAVKRPIEYLVPYPVPPEEFSPGIATWYNSVCTMCSAGCGISVRTREGRAKKIEGNPSHPVNQGRLCALGQAGLQALYNPDRITTPLIRKGETGGGRFVQTTWEEGLDALAGKIGEADGANVALLSSGLRGHLGQLLEMFMQGVGSDRILFYDFEHPQTLDAAIEKFFGQDELPYYDIGNATYLLSFGADYLGNWLSPVHYGLGFGHGRQGTDHRNHCVQVEPRMSLSGAAADEWVPAKPGTEGILALGIAHRIVAEHYTGLDHSRWSRVLADYAPEAVAEATGIQAETITRLADEFAAADAALAIGGGAAAGASNAVDSLVAINALNHLADNVGKPGGIVFNPQNLLRTASKSNRAGLRELTQLAADAHAGNIEVLIVNGTNPAFSLPESAGIAAALAEIPTIVSLSSFMDETTALADIVLPSHTYLEAWGDDAPNPGVGLAVAAISQPVVAPLYNTRATGDIILDTGKRLGMANLVWEDTEAFLKDSWRRLYRVGGGGSESFDDFWRSVLQAGTWGATARGAGRPFSPARSVIDAMHVAGPEYAGGEDEYPFALHPYVSNNLRDGRGANLPWLQELPDQMTSIVYGSWVEVNPATAAELGVREGDIVSVESPAGAIEAPVYVYQAIRPDVIAIPIGQGHSDYGRYAKGRGVNPLQILAAQEEPVTGSLAVNATRVKLTKTGRHVEIVKTAGEGRELGRNIVQTTGDSHGDGHGGGHSAKLQSFPIKVESA